MIALLITAGIRKKSRAERAKRRSSVFDWGTTADMDNMETYEKPRVSLYHCLALCKPFPSSYFPPSTTLPLNLLPWPKQTITLSTFPTPPMTLQLLPLLRKGQSPCLTQSDTILNTRTVTVSNPFLWSPIFLQHSLLLKLQPKLKVPSQRSLRRRMWWVLAVLQVQLV